MERELEASKLMVEDIKRQILFPDCQLRFGGEGVYVGIRDLWLERLSGEFKIHMSNPVSKKVSHGGNYTTTHSPPHTPITPPAHPTTPQPHHLIPLHHPITASPHHPTTHPIPLHHPLQSGTKQANILIEVTGDPLRDPGESTRPATAQKTPARNNKPDRRSSWTGQKSGSKRGMGTAEDAAAASTPSNTTTPSEARADGGGAAAASSPATPPVERKAGSVGLLVRLSAGALKLVGERGTAVPRLSITQVCGPRPYATRYIPARSRWLPPTIW